MPAVHTAPDHCTTAQDVINAALVARRKRERSYRLHKPRPARFSLLAPIVMAAPALDVETLCIGLIPEINTFKIITGTFAERIERYTSFSTGVSTQHWEGGSVSVPHTIIEIQRAVALHAFVSRSDLTSSRRQARLIIPRHVAIALCKHLTSFSFPAIGRLFGNRDHSTICYTVQKMAPVINEVAATLPDTATVDDWARMALEVAERIKPKRPLKPLQMREAVE